jgi:hypothetical protein
MAALQLHPQKTWAALRQLLLALALAAVLLLAWAPAVAAGGFEDEGVDEGDVMDVAMDLSIKDYEVRARVRACSLVWVG